MTEQTGWCRLRDGTIADVNAVTAIYLNLMAIWEGGSPVLGPAEARRIVRVLCTYELMEIAADTDGMYQPSNYIADILVTVGLLNRAADGPTYRMHEMIRAVVRSTFVSAGGHWSDISARHPIAETNVPTPE